MLHIANKHIEPLIEKSTATVRRHVGIMYILATILLLLPTEMAMGQNNPFKIDDQLYSIYQRAYSKRSSDECIPIADTLKNKSILLGDKKAECLAYTIYLQHCYDKRDDVNIVKAVEELKRVSRKNGYLQYYYYGPTLYITYLLNNGKSMLAMQENAKLQTEAHKDNSQYGILTCLRNMAKIQTSRGSYYMANKYYEEALEYMLQNVTDQDPTSLYKELADYKRMCGKYDEAMNLIEKGLASARTAVTKSRALQEKCVILYDMERYDDFKKYYNEWITLEKGIRYDSSETATLIKIYKLLSDGEVDKALELAEKTRQRDNVHYLKSVIYKKIGNSIKALEEYQMSRMIHDSIIGTVQASDIAEMNVQVANQMLQEKLKRKEEEAIELKFKHMQQQADMQRERALNEHLKISNQQLELENLKREKMLLDSENDRQKVVMEQRENKDKYHNKIVTISAIAAIIILSGLIFALIRHRIMLRELNIKNRELEEARDKANSANEIKTKFIHNMSHEIRTPLNSIVGFSDILTTPGMKFSEEEAAEFGLLIRKNSELLTSLVNDLLGLAELESGKYTLNIEPALCNSICCEAIATVTLNRPDGVDLRFTTDIDNDYMLTTDERRVKQVLINYLTNAEKHTKEGYIELRCSQNENPGYITFSVTDTGTGIAPEDIGKLFQRFDKLDNFEKGFGLGLSICAAIAEKLHGEVKLDTSYTQGARFVFIHPINQEKA